MRLLRLAIRQALHGNFRPLAKVCAGLMSRRCARCHGIKGVTPYLFCEPCRNANLLRAIFGEL